MSCTRGPRFGVVALVVQLFFVVLASSAAATEARSGPAYELRLDLDLPIVLIAGATASSYLFMYESPTVTCVPSCDESQINALDRGAAGLYDKTWAGVGDIAAALAISIPPLVVLLDEGFEDGLNDDIVVLEATLVTTALQVSLSQAITRPRPYVYSDEASLEQRTSANAGRSFFSGHVANAMATSVAAMRTFQRLGKPRMGWLMLGVGLAGSTFIGVSRVVAGAHFPSDLIAGAAIGTGMGLALPAVHGSGVRVLPQAGADTVGLAVRGPFP